MLGRVLVEGDRLALFGGERQGARSSRGILIGNAGSAVVRDNHVHLDAAGIAAKRWIHDGVQFHGLFGRFVIVRNNDVAGCHTGVRMVALNRSEDGPLTYRAGRAPPACRWSSR